MPAKYVLTWRARVDLEEVWEYIANDDNVAADKTIERLVDAIALLSGNPNAGRKRPTLGNDLRSFPVGSYVIFYMIAGRTVHVVRILHAARDVENLL